MSDGITSPVICVVLQAASRRMLAAKKVLNMPQPKVPPVSAVMILAISCARAFQEIGGLPEDRAALARRRLRPFAEGGGGGAHGGGRIERPGIGHARDELAGERIALLVEPAVGGARVAAPDAHGDTLHD